jgi:hypothetical protein
MMQQAIEHYRTHVYASILRSPTRRTAGHHSDTPHGDAGFTGPRSCTDFGPDLAQLSAHPRCGCWCWRGSSMNDRDRLDEDAATSWKRCSSPARGRPRSRRQSAAPVPRSFVGHDQQCEGGSPFSPAPSVPAENVHPSPNRHSPLAPARADGRCHASWERTSARP